MTATGGSSFLSVRDSRVSHLEWFELNTLAPLTRCENDVSAPKESTALWDLNLAVAHSSPRSIMAYLLVIPRAQHLFWSSCEKHSHERPLTYRVV